jgi:hypothetical protein
MSNTDLVALYNCPAPLLVPRVLYLDCGEGRLLKAFPKETHLPATAGLKRI